MIRSSSKNRIAAFTGSAALVCLTGLPAACAAQSAANNDAQSQPDAKQRVVMLQNSSDKNVSAQPPDSKDRSNVTRSPIRHVILIIGENRTFDHVFATYTPPAGQTILNLLSENIVNEDGTPGAKVASARQWQATDTEVYSNSPAKTQPYSVIPDVNTTGAPTTPLTATALQAEAIEPALPKADYGELASGGTGLAKNTVDTRLPRNLPNAPVNLHQYISYDDYASNPIHRFFQMWQQIDCDAKLSTRQNPSGCQNDLFTWVATSVGSGANGAAQPPDFTDQTTNQGSTPMEFLNVAKGDAPYFTQLARQFTLSDNFHQAIEGGTGANHIVLGYGSLIFYADANGRPATPPALQIENPNPVAGTNNWYTQDGYGEATTGGGGSYVNCADDSQPGVKPIRTYLHSLPYKPFRNGDCAANEYYLVNNYNPGYLGTGEPAPLGPAQFTIPPTRQNNIGLLLTKHHVTWKYYGEGFNSGKEDGEDGTFCNICNPFLYSTQIMTNPTLRANNMDITDLYNDIRNGTLPAVSIAKPDGLLDGHPASSKLDLFEGFTQKIVEMVQANPAVWKDTAVMVTFDEGGGYYDSGYVQPIDFFGDGTRVPFLVVSKYSRGGRVVHTYYDHVSFDKFVEANWNLHETISPMGRDNLPNPVVLPANPYVPVNQPAIGDLFEMFNFSEATRR